jgi:hypothetical protein
MARSFAQRQLKIGEPFADRITHAHHKILRVVRLANLTRRRRRRDCQGSKWPGSASRCQMSAEDAGLSSGGAGTGSREDAPRSVRQKILISERTVVSHAFTWCPAARGRQFLA